MKRNIIIFALLLGFTLFLLPTDSGSVFGQGKSGKSVGKGRVYPQVPGTWRKKNAFGYRNYGQYRRTQVGNRRYRLARRYYWRDGIRLSRYVRIYY